MTVVYFGFLQSNVQTGKRTVDVSDTKVLPTWSFNVLLYY